MSAAGTSSVYESHDGFAIPVHTSGTSGFTGHGRICESRDYKKKLGEQSEQ